MYFISFNFHLFSVIFPKECRTLGDNHALHEEHLKENDVLLLVKKRSANPPDSDKDLDLKTPTAAEILAATKNLPVPTPPSSKNHASSSGRQTGYTNHHHEDSSTETSIDVRFKI